MERLRFTETGSGAVPDPNGCLVGSRLPNGAHAPVLDLDFEAKLVPSSTPGHFHLYVEKEVPWEKYERVLFAMKEASLISEKWYRWAVRDQASQVLLPGLTKAEVRARNMLNRDSCDDDGDETS